MMLAVEDFCGKRNGARPPAPFGRMIEDLGGDCFGCRQRASKRLAAASRDDQRWLFWGRRHRDPEIRFRCNDLLWRLNRCPDCTGDGVCLSYRPTRPDSDGPCRVCGRWAWSHPEERNACLSCGGIGSAWDKGAFD